VAGITTNEGQSYIAEAVYKQLGLDLKIGLFTNTGSLSVTSAWADIVQPTGGGYAEKDLVAASFTVGAGGVTTYAQQTWTAVATTITPDVYGYYIRTDEGTPRLLHFEFNDGPRSIADGDSYRVDLSTDTENG
jgi:hypothetical protein